MVQLPEDLEMEFQAGIHEISFLMVKMAKTEEEMQETLHYATEKLHAILEVPKDFHSDF
jgi:hypothetical protein